MATGIQFPYLGHCNEPLQVEVVAARHGGRPGFTGSLTLVRALRVRDLIVVVSHWNEIQMLVETGAETLTSERNITVFPQMLI